MKMWPRGGLRVTDTEEGTELRVARARNNNANE